MDFYAVLDQVVDLLRSRQRATYRTLKRQFNLYDTALEDLKEELLFTHPQIVDEDGRGLVWTGDADSAAAPDPTSPSTVSEVHQAREPLSYTPQYLAEKILTSRSVLEGERKQVTVLFADLKGSTELIADLDPEAARQLLDPALHHMMEAVHRYEGTVNQVLGDGIMALFGAPLAHEDHALRACYAALAMQAAHGATSASGKSPCQPCTPVPGLPYAMPNWECSLRVVPSGQKGGRLLRRWRTPVAACGPTGESVCCASAKATCPGHCHSSNGLWAFVTR